VPEVQGQWTQAAHAGKETEDVSDEKRFEAAKVAGLAQDIERLESEVARLRQVSKDADSAKNKAECELANKRSEFTRYVDGQIDERAMTPRQRPMPVQR
jgi:uncharacterized protein YlxW (UPF0749 family)